MIIYNIYRQYTCPYVTPSKAMEVIKPKQYILTLCTPLEQILATRLAKGIMPNAGSDNSVSGKGNTYHRFK